MSQEQPAVIVKNLYKTFKLPHEQHSGIKQAVVNIFQGNRGYEIQKVLDDVSFEIKKGEFFGIVGRNGSGKSTLLKLLAGIYAPDKGLVQVNGSLTPFIELGVGFNHELTGRENVFMNGALLGFDRHEMAAMYDSIVDFAELHDFMDQKLKNYSSGMQVRLAFSIAIRAKTDILLIDEVLAVGDAAFQQKCFEFFMDIKKSGRTLILVTHDMSAVSRFCDKALFINNGVVESIGAPKEIADKYLQMSFDSAAGASVSNPNPGTSNNDLGEKIKAVSINGIKDGRPSIKTGSKCTIGFEYTNPERKQLNFGVQIFNESGNYCFGTNTTVDGLKPVDAKEGKVEVEAVMRLVPGQYSVTIAIMNGDGTSVLVYKPDSAAFRIAQSTQVEGVANLEYTWSMKSV